MQKLPVIGARPEFMVSVPSACQDTKPESSWAPSGMPTLFFDVKVNCHRPVIGSSSCSTFKAPDAARLAAGEASKAADASTCAAALSGRACGNDHCGELVLR